MGVGDRAVAVRLRRPVHVAELASAHRLHRHLDVLRETDGQAGAHGVEPPPATIGMLQHGARHVRHAVVHAAPLALEQLQRFPRLEALLQHRAPAVRQDRGQRVRRAERPEERHGEPEPIRGRQMLALSDVEPVLDDAAVRERDAFRRGRRSRGVQEVAHVTRAHRPLPLPQRRGAQAGPPPQEVLRLEHSVHAPPVHGHDGPEPRQSFASKGSGRARGQLGTEVVERVEVGAPPKGRDRDEGHRLGMLEHPAQLAGRGEGADRRHDAADLGDGERGHDPLRAVRQQYRDSIAARHPHRDERARELVDASAQCGVGEMLVAEGERLGVRPFRGHLVEEIPQRPARRARAHRPVNRGGRPSRCAAMPSSTSRLHSRA